MSAARKMALPSATAESVRPVVENQHLAPLHKLSTWVAWDGTAREDGKANKAPINPRTGRNAKTNDPSTWATFKDAIRAAVKLPHASGVGLNMVGTGYLGGDLDGVVDQESGYINPAALRYLGAIGNTYVERSPSKTGLRFFLRGDLPEELRHCTKYDDAFGKGTGLELYDGRGGGRYLTVTGHTWTHEPIAAVNGQLVAAMAHVDVPEEKCPKPRSTKPARSQQEQERPVGHVPGSDLHRARWGLLQQSPPLVDPSIGNDEWVKVGFELSNLGDAGADLYVEWSRGSDKFGKRDEHRCRIGIAEKADGRREIGSLFNRFDDACPDWRDVYDREHRIGRHAPIDALTQAFIDRANESQGDPERSASVEIPDRYFDPEHSGIIADVANWVSSMAEVPSEAVSIGTALSFASMIVGNRACVEAQGKVTQFNLQLGVIAPTGASKSLSMKSAKSIGAKADILGDKLLSGTLASSRALERRIEEHRVCTLMSDEFDEIMSDLSREDGHHTGMSGLFRKLHESREKEVTQYAKKEDQTSNEQFVDGVCFSFLGIGTETTLEKLGAEHVVNGFLNRFLLFVDDKGFREPRMLPIDMSSDPPEALVAKAKELHEKLGESVPFASYGGAFVPVGLTPEAAEMLHLVSVRAAESQHYGDKRVATCRVRWRHNTLKLAGLHAVIMSDCLTDLRVGVENVEWALGLSTVSVRSMEREVLRRMFRVDPDEEFRKQVQEAGDKLIEKFGSTTAGKIRQQSRVWRKDEAVVEEIAEAVERVIDGGHWKRDGGRLTRG